MRWLWISGGVGLGLVAACSESNSGEPPNQTAGTGGSVASGGSDATTGGRTTSPSGGKPSTGGSVAASTGGAPNSGGALASNTGGAAAASGGASPSETGGAQAGGDSAADAGADGAPPDSADVTVRLDRTRQTIEGFGISNVFRYSMTDEDAEQLFDVEKGLGLTILRVLAQSNGYPAPNVQSEVEKALAHGAKTFIGVSWSGPAECKTNLDEDNGGFLEASCYESYSDALAAFPGRFKEATGVDLYGLSPQNEPDFASCGDNPPVPPCYGNYPTMLYTPEQMVDFVKVLGPKIRALDPPVRLMGPETQEWNHLWTNRSAEGATDPLDGKYDYGHALFADPVAWGFLDLLATHQYSTQVAEPWPSDVPQDKPIWMTEMAGIEYWPEGVATASIENGVVHASWIHDALVTGNASAWICAAYRPFRIGDNIGLVLEDGTVAKRYYTLGNFSRFVRPGFERVSVTGAVPDALLLSAYRGPDDQLVILAINRGAASVSLPIFVSGGAVPGSVTPIVTSASDNLAVRTDIALDEGSFMAVLGGQTVTTFVGSGG